MEVKRKIPLKNYYLFALLIIITVLISGYILYYDIELKNYNLGKFILEGYIDQVSEDELENYIRDNGNTVVYACVIDDEECRQFEKKFMKMIKKYDLYEKIVYLNMGKTDKNNGPLFKIYKDRELINTLDLSEEKKIKLDEIIKFMKENEIIEND